MNAPYYRHRDLSITAFLRRVFLVPVFATLWTLILPALIAHSGGVFYTEDMKPQMEDAVRQKLQTFEAEQKRRQDVIDAFDAMITVRMSRASHDPDVVMLSQVRDDVVRAKRDAKEPVKVIPFYLNPQMLLWPCIYTCLCWIAMLLTPVKERLFRSVLLSRDTIELSLITYVFYAWPLWLRNFVLRDEGRVVYAYPNVDIHPLSFAMQELIVFGFCVLLAVIWRQWGVYLMRVRRDDPQGHALKPYLDLLTDRGAATSFSEVFFRWLYTSALLALGFLGLTAFYWNLVGEYGDKRYLLSAIHAHVLWGLTWIMLTLPLLNEWRIWDRCRTFAFQELAKSGEYEKAGTLAALIKEIQPVTGGTLIVANTASAVSFVLPIVQAFAR